MRRQYPLLSSQARYLECGLVGLGTGVAEEYPGIAIAHPSLELLRNLNHRLASKKIGYVRQLSHLLAYRLNYGRMPVA